MRNGDAIFQRLFEGLQLLSEPVSRWRRERKLHRALRDIALRGDRHLLDDLGHTYRNAGASDDAVPFDGRCHRFWML